MVVWRSWAVCCQWCRNSFLPSNLDANKALLAADKFVSQGAHIVTQQFWIVFFILSGIRYHFWVVVAMLFAAKSKQYKALGKLLLSRQILMSTSQLSLVFRLWWIRSCSCPLFWYRFWLLWLSTWRLVVGFMQPFAGVTLPLEHAGYYLWLYGRWLARAVIQMVILSMSVLCLFPICEVSG